MLNPDHGQGTFVFEAVHRRANQPLCKSGSSNVFGDRKEALPGRLVRFPGLLESSRQRRRKRVSVGLSHFKAPVIKAYDPGSSGWLRLVHYIWKSANLLPDRILGNQPAGLLFPTHPSLAAILGGSAISETRSDKAGARREYSIWR